MEVILTVANIYIYNIFIEKILKIEYSTLTISSAQPLSAYALALTFSVFRTSVAS